MSGDETVASPSPTSWKDVYTLVQDVEKRLTTRMDDIASAAKQTTADHEVRIRVLEKTTNSTSGRDAAGMTIASGAQRLTAVAIAAVAVVIALVK